MNRSARSRRVPPTDRRYATGSIGYSTREPMQPTEVAEPMKSFRIALYPGDGIGVEVLNEAVRVLGCVQEIVGGFELLYTQFDWGCAYAARHGHVTPADYLETLRPFDAIFLGAIGDPRCLPDPVTLVPLVQIRQRFDQYACLRPAKLYPGVRSPLRQPGAIDLLIVRENSEGEYAVCGGRVKTGRPEEIAIQSAVHTRAGVQRILRFAFASARTRRRRLTMITKSNALPYGMALWDAVLEEVCAEFPDVQAERQNADAAAMNLVRRPERFDVIVASNLFGDILSDLAGEITGGIGLAPSANVNPERVFPSMFEPVHGSAPDIAGKGIANPIAAILSGALMLEWLGLNEAAARVRRAVERALADGAATPDLGGSLTTGQMTDRVIQGLDDAGA